MQRDEFATWRKDWGSKTIRTCGFLAASDKSGVVVTLSKDIKDREVQSVSQVIEIPLGVIKSIRTMK